MAVRRAEQSLERRHRLGQNRLHDASKLRQADLFADFDQVQTLTGRRKHARVVNEGRRFRVVNHEGAARLLDSCDDYRVLRRLKPRQVDASYRPGSGEFVAVIVDVETTGLDHRRDEIIEIGMVSFVHDAEGRIGPVIGALSMLREPSIEITPEITN